MADKLNTTVGALLLGTLLTAFGFGITTMQTYMYMSRFPNDPKPIRWTVWTLLILDITHVALTWHMIYWYLILNYNNSPTLDLSVWSFDITVVITALVTVVAHCFYARRVYILGNQQWIIAALILILSAMRLVFGCYVTVRIFQIKVLSMLWGKIGVEVGVGLGAGTAADILITSSLVWYIRGHKGFNNHTDNIVDRITFWTINNGILTSIVGLVVIITMITMPNNMIYLAWHLLLSKLYANALLATLNFRRANRGRGLEDEDEQIQLSIRRHTGTALQFSGKDSVLAPVVHVMTTTMTDAPYRTADTPYSVRSDKDFEESDERLANDGIKEVTLR